MTRTHVWTAAIVAVLSASGVAQAQTVISEGAPAPVYSAPMTYSSAPVTYSGAPVTYSSAPVSYSPAPVSYSPAPVSYSPAPISYSPAPTYQPAPVVSEAPISVQPSYSPSTSGNYVGWYYASPHVVHETSTSWHYNTYYSPVRNYSPPLRKRRGAWCRSTGP